MYTSKEMEKLWQKYQSEGVARNLTLQAFCSMNNVPYNSFEKYLKTRRNMSDIPPVNITDVPEDMSSEKDDTNDTASDDRSKDKASDSGSNTRIMVSIRMTNGMQISQRNLDYRGLCRLVEKLEGLC